MKLEIRMEEIGKRHEQLSFGVQALACLPQPIPAQAEACTPNASLSVRRPGEQLLELLRSYFVLRIWLRLRRLRIDGSTHTRVRNRRVNVWQCINFNLVQRKVVA